MTESSAPLKEVKTVQFGILSPDEIVGSQYKMKAKSVMYHTLLNNYVKVPLT